MPVIWDACYAIANTSQIIPMELSDFLDTPRPKNRSTAWIWREVRKSKRKY